MGQYLLYVFLGLLLIVLTRFVHKRVTGNKDKDKELPDDMYTLY